jgi:divalent metal cation (Fe/Co/Zn/Cd) transporter
MKTFLSVLFSLVAVGAQAHESLAPHHHPHGLSMLPDLGTLAVGAIVLAAALLVYFKFRRG